MRRKDRLVTDKNQIAEILKEGHVVHIALQDKNEPYIVTLNYGYDYSDDQFRLYFHCANEGRKIDILKVNPRVCFSISICDSLVTGEKACNYGMKFRSIVGCGTMRILIENDQRIHALNKLMDNYASGSNWQYDENILKLTTIICMDVEKFSAKIKK